MQFCSFAPQVRGSDVLQDVLQLLLCSQAVVVKHLEQVRWAFEGEAAQGSGGPLHRGGHELAGQEGTHHLLPLRGEVHEVRTDSRDLVHSRLLAEEEVCAVGTRSCKRVRSDCTIHCVLMSTRWHEDTLQQFERLHRTRNLLRRKNRNNVSCSNRKKPATASKGYSGIVDDDDLVIQTTGSSKGRRCRRIARDQSYEEVRYASATFDI